MSTPLDFGYKNYNHYGAYLKKKYDGQRVYKIIADAGFTCPNRDGSKGYGGCTYCNVDSFTPELSRRLPTIREQIEQGMERAVKNYRAEKFIIYFQPNTNTYAPTHYLKMMYDEALSINTENIVGLSVGTRPDCIDREKIDLLESYSDRFDVDLEMGMESIYDETLLSDEVKAELSEYSRRLAAHQDISDVVPPASLLATLRPYQQHGLNWLNFLDDFNFGGCLADDMGLGKSLQIIAFILSQRTKRGMTTNMIVVPTSLIFNWLAEIEKFAPSLKVFTAYGSSRTKSIREFDQYEIILTSYGTLVSDLNYFKKFHFNYVFFDESQNMKNPQSQRNMAARALSSRSKIVITGTPVENNTFDLYGQLSISCPGLLGSLTHFRDVYSSPIDKFGVKKRTTELQKKVAPFILRRTKDQVAPELPEKIEMVVYCEMQPEQRHVYNAYEKEFREYISSKTDDDLSKSSMYVLKGITRLRQICDSPALVGEKVSGPASSAKIETLITHIEDKSSGNKVLVFSQFVTMLDLIKTELEEKGIAYSYLTGRTKNREAVINQFQDDPNIRVFLISLKAGGTGLNLTGANYVYIVDPWWNPAVENQAIDRCYRIGQKKNVVAVRLICPDTVEEKIVKLQQSKTDRMNNLIKTDSSMIKSLSKKELLGLFSSD